MGLLDRIAPRKGDFEPSHAASVAAEDPVFTTKALHKFLTCLTSRESPVLLDLGPVVGSNVSFFGEQLGCKIIVEDLFKDIDRHVREGTLDDLPAALSKRFRHESASIDGILCWDVFDYLDKNSAKKLAEQLTRILRPEGVLLAFFVTAEPQPGARPEYTRHIVIDPNHLQHRSYAAARGKQRPMPNRDIQRMFEELRITEQFLLKSNLREVLFRKPAEAPPSSPPAAR
jgi:SAM-dependent methyltransferase